MVLREARLVARYNALPTICLRFLLSARLSQERLVNGNDSPGGVIPHGAQLSVLPNLYHKTQNHLFPVFFCCTISYSRIQTQIFPLSFAAFDPSISMSGSRFL